MSISSAGRGKPTLSWVSQCAIGDGVNAENIKVILRSLMANGYDGVLSMECEGEGGPMIEQGLAWLRGALAEIGAAS